MDYPLPQFRCTCCLEAHAVTEAVVEKTMGRVCFECDANIAIAKIKLKKANIGRSFQASDVNVFNAKRFKDYNIPK